MRVRSHRLCSSPNPRRAAPLRVSSPRYAADAPCRFPSPINQPLRVAVTLDCALVNWQVLSRPTPSKRLTCEAVTDTQLRTRRSSDLSQMIINPVNRDRRLLRFVG